MAQSVKNLPTISATQIRSLGGEDPPEKGVSHALQYSCLENPHVPTGCSPSQASHPRGSLAHPTQFQAWLHPTPGCSLQDTAPRAQLAGDLAAAAVPVRAAPPRGSSPPRLFRSRCPPPPTPAFPLPLGRVVITPVPSACRARCSGHTDPMGPVVTRYSAKLGSVCAVHRKARPLTQVVGRTAQPFLWPQRRGASSSCSEGPDSGWASGEGLTGHLISSRAALRLVGGEVTR